MFFYDRHNRGQIICGLEVRKKTESSSWNRNQKQDILSEKKHFLIKGNTIKNKYINYKRIVKIDIL